MFKNYIFDLDGTLLESYEGLQEAFTVAFEKTYHTKCPYDIKAHIGPSMIEIIIKLHKESNAEMVKQFVSNFKLHYDNIAYHKYRFYDGAIEVLKKLKQKNKTIFISTYKRIKPTSHILEQQGVYNWFKALYSIDTIKGDFRDKVDMTTYLLATEKIDPHTTLFIGDTIKDFEAANNNNLKFAYAKYGYGKLKAYDFKLEKITDLIDQTVH